MTFIKTFSADGASIIKNYKIQSDIYENIFLIRTQIWGKESQASMDMKKMYDPIYWVFRMRKTEENTEIFIAITAIKYSFIVVAVLAKVM